MSISLTAPLAELVSCVVANIESLLTLSNLARCLRQLYLFTIPHLYHHVTIQDEMKEVEEPNGKLRNLASLLIRRPDLAALVPHLTLHLVRPLWWGEASSEESADSEYSEEPKEPEELEEHVSPEIFAVDQAFKTAANALILSKEEERNRLRQLSDIHKCHDDLILTLLCSALPKVEKLDLDLGIGPDTHYLEEMIRRAAWRERPFDLQPPFEALTAFVQTNDMSNLRSTGLVTSLLKLPAIKEISGCFGDTWGDGFGEIVAVNKNLSELDSSLSPLISLDLAAWAVSRADLGHMLRAPKALKTLFFKSCNPYYIGFTDLGHALGPQKDCLESLGLDYDDDYDGWMPWTILEAVENLLAQKSSRQIPSLQKLILEEIIESIDGKPEKLMDVLWRGTQETAIERLSRVAAAQGVSLYVMEALVDDDVIVAE